MLLRRPTDSKSYITHDDLNIYMINDGLLSDLLMHDRSKTKWAVDTSVLNAAMDNIIDEFDSLVR